MTLWYGSQRWLVSSQVLIAVAWFIFAALSAQCQSSPAAQVADCPTTDDQATSPRGEANDSIATVRPEIQRVGRSSFPELVHIDLRVRAFRSQSDYFRTRFSWSRFLLLMQMRYFVDVNPALLQRQAPSNGTCAIVAHELVHVASLSRGNRIRRLGLIRLISERYTVKFERGADLEAIHRGYGDGLKVYRTWVYNHIPPDELRRKLRTYFSPEEIEAIQMKLLEQPDRFEYWKQHVPRNLQEIQRTR
jgi:hypothetical protein